MKIKKILTSVALIICTLFMVFGFSGCADGDKNMKKDICEITDSYTNVLIDIETADIHLLKTESDQTSVSSYLHNKTTLTAEVVDDTLVVKIKDTRKWYEKIFNFSSPHIGITMPESKDYASLTLHATTGDVYVDKFQFENINIKLTTGDVSNYASSTGVIKVDASTGDIRMEDISAGSVGCAVTTGDIKLVNVNSSGNVKTEASTGKMSLTNVTCKNFTVDGGTGDVILKSVLADEKFNIDVTTGDVKFDRCDAAELDVETTTGDVTGTLRTDKIFITKATTGKINVPETTTGGVCKIKVTTGDIKISIYEE